MQLYASWLIGKAPLIGWRRVKSEKRIRKMSQNARDVQVPMPWGVFALKTWNSPLLEPMLVLHGVDDNAASFDHLIPLLLEEYHYVCVDLPGHGLSSAFTPGLPLSFMQYISALQRLIHHFGWRTMSIMGHSFGANIALVLAAATCQFTKVQIRKIILIDGTVNPPVADEVYLTKCVTEFENLLRAEENHKNRSQTTTFEEAVQKAQNRIFPLPKHSAEAIARRELVKTGGIGFFKTSDFRTLWNTAPDMSENVHLYNCSIITCPVQLINPEQSKIYEFHRSSEFYRNISLILTSSHSLSRSNTVKGDHNVHCENPHIVAEVINQFLNETKNAKNASRCKF